MTTDRRFRVREVFTTSDPSFEPAYALYESSFPVDERETRKTVERRMDPERFWLKKDSIPHFLVCVDDGRVIAMRIHDYYPATGLGWLVYNAVAPEMQGQGLGSLMLTCGIESCRLDAAFNGDHFRGAICEVENPEDAASHEERLLREKRLSFFRKHAAQVLTDSYVQPALSEASQPVPLLLLLLGTPSAPSVADKSLIVADFMSKLWGLSTSDPFHQRALAGVR